MVQASHRLKARALAAVLAAFALAACAVTVPESAPERQAGETSRVPAEPHGGMSAAGEALLIQSANERRSGDYRAASATLERALRIEPSQPALWLELARVRLLEGNFAQAGQLARKAGSLAAAGSALAEESRRLVEEARKRRAGL